VTYSIAVVLAVVVASCLDLGILRTNMLGRKAFWVAYAIVLFFQLLVNGLLTGLRIVRYDASVITGAHIAYAPVEDLLFGFALVVLTLASWAAVNRRAKMRSRRGRETRTRRSSTR
jgi:lycopene cyclase domain-containing protein